MNYEYQRLAKKYRSPMHYILAGLIPYSEANIKLSFKPNAFFNDLEKLDRIKANKKALKATYYRAINKGYIKIDQQAAPVLTKKGKFKLALYAPKKLKNAKLMVIFDIPELERAKRSYLRVLLRQLKFRQVQKSVWVTDYDFRDYVIYESEQYGFRKYLKIYEALEI